MSIKHVIGALILLGFFATLFAALAKSTSLQEAIFIFSGAIISTVVIIIAISLLSS